MFYIYDLQFTIYDQSFFMVLKTGSFLSFLRCKDKQIHWYLEVMRVFFMEGSGGVFRQCSGGISTALFPIIVSTLSKKR